jgi:hypothetical protein
LLVCLKRSNEVGDEVEHSEDVVSLSVDKQTSLGSLLQSFNANIGQHITISISVLAKIAGIEYDWDLFRDGSNLIDLTRDILSVEAIVEGLYLINEVSSGGEA